MTEYDNTNRGILSRNERKEKDTHPDLSGTINVDGVEYWLSGWSKKSKAGKPFFSLSIKPKEAREERQERAKPVAQNDLPYRGEFQDDDIPF